MGSGFGLPEVVFIFGIFFLAIMRKSIILFLAVAVLMLGVMVTSAGVNQWVEMGAAVLMVWAILQVFNTQNWRI